MLKPRSRLYMYLAAGLVFLAAGILLLSWSERRRLANYRARRQWARLVACDREQNPEKALAICLRLAGKMPPVALRIMRRRWQLALELYRRQSWKKPEEAGPRPESSPTESGRKLDKELFALEKTGQHLRGLSPTPPAEIAWRVENLLGAGYLLRALLVLDRGGEIEACRALLHQAIAAFKRAISLVDQLPAASGFGNLPRWNLELLLASDRVGPTALADSIQTSRYDLRRNLTILVPGSSGYLAGEPPDNRVLK